MDIETQHFEAITFFWSHATPGSTKGYKINYIQEYHFVSYTFQTAYITSESMKRYIICFPKDDTRDIALRNMYTTTGTIILYQSTKRQ